MRKQQRNYQIDGSEILKRKLLSASKRRKFYSNLGFIILVIIAISAVLSCIWVYFYDM